MAGTQARHGGTVPNEDYLDGRRLELLAAVVESVGRKVGTSGVKPEDIGEELGLTADEIQEYTSYWMDKGCLKSLTMYSVAITADAIDAVDKAEANRQFAQLREEYIEAGYPKAEPPNAVNVRPGDVVHGSQHTATATGSTLGALAVGDGSTATNPSGSSSSVTQEQLRSAIRQAQIALVDDQDTLAQMDARQYEVLHQFLRLAREIQVEQKSLAEVQAKLKETLDEVRAHQFSGEVRPRALPETLKVIEALLKSPATAALVPHVLAQLSGS
jgi:hypothetical protein